MFYIIFCDKKSKSLKIKVPNTHEINTKEVYKLTTVKIACHKKAVLIITLTLLVQVTTTLLLVCQTSFLLVTLGWWTYNLKIKIMRMFSIVPITANRIRNELVTLEDKNKHYHVKQYATCNVITKCMQTWELMILMFGSTSSPDNQDRNT